MSEKVPTRAQRRRGVPAPLRGPKYDAKRLEVNRLRDQALRLRLSGGTLAEISRAMERPLSTVQRWIDEAVSAVPLEKAKEMRAVALLKLDRREAVLNEYLLSHKEDTVRVVTALLRVDERRSKLCGLDAPSRTEHTGRGGGPIMHGAVDLEGMTDEQLQRFIDDPGAFYGGAPGARGPGDEEAGEVPAPGARRHH